MRSNRPKNKGSKFIYLILITVAILFTISHYKNEILKQMYPVKYSDYVYKYSEQYKLDPFLVFSLIRVESNFNPNAKSDKGAKGLMQIMDTTGAEIAKKAKMGSFSSEKLFEPEYNIRLGCWYLKNLTNQFDGNIVLALAAYNGGSGNVEKWLKNKEYSATGEHLERIPFAETDKYVQKIKKDYNIYKSLYEKKEKQFN